MNTQRELGSRFPSKVAGGISSSITVRRQNEINAEVRRFHKSLTDNWSALGALFLFGSVVSICRYLIEVGVPPSAVAQEVFVAAPILMTLMLIFLLTLAAGAATPGFVLLSRGTGSEVSVLTEVLSVSGSRGLTHLIIGRGLGLLLVSACAHLIIQTVERVTGPVVLSFFVLLAGLSLLTDLLAIAWIIPKTTRLRRLKSVWHVFLASALVQISMLAYMGVIVERALHEYPIWVPFGLITAMAILSLYQSMCVWILSRIVQVPTLLRRVPSFVLGALLLLFHFFPGVHQAVLGYAMTWYAAAGQKCVVLSWSHGAVIHTELTGGDASRSVMLSVPMLTSTTIYVRPLNTDLGGGLFTIPISAVSRFGSC